MTAGGDVEEAGPMKERKTAGTEVPPDGAYQGSVDGRPAVVAVEGGGTTVRAAWLELARDGSWIVRQNAWDATDGRFSATDGRGRRIDVRIRAASRRPPGDEAAGGRVP